MTKLIDDMISRKALLEALKMPKGIEQHLVRFTGEHIVNLIANAPTVDIAKIFEGYKAPEPLPVIPLTHEQLNTPFGTGRTVQREGWVSVEDRLPDDGFGSPYRTFITKPVLMIGTWREDYPIVGHFVLQEFNDRAGCNAGIKFNHPKGYKYYSATCPYIEIDNLGATFRNKLPLAFTKAVTHWQIIQAAPTDTE